MSAKRRKIVSKDATADDNKIIRGIAKSLLSSRARSVVRLAQNHVSQLSRRKIKAPTQLRVNDNAARAFVDVLSQHPVVAKPYPIAQCFDMSQEDPIALEWRRRSTDVLIAGTIAIGWIAADSDPLFDALLHVAFSADGGSLLLRDILMPGKRPVDPEERLEALRDGIIPFERRMNDCFPRIRAASSRMAQNVAMHKTIQQNPYIVDAQGITGLVPNGGSSGTFVRIKGNFSPTPSGDVYFPQAGGGCIRAEFALLPGSKSSWSPTQIIVRAPEPVGEGPVGFVRGGSTGAYDPSAANALAAAIRDCLGPLAEAHVPFLTTPPLHIVPPPCPPTLPDNANVFYGGPVLDQIIDSAVGVHPTLPSAHNRDVVTLLGRNFVSTDLVEIDGTINFPQSISKSRIKFSLSGVPGGYQEVRIRRGHRSSNSLAMWVQPTVSKIDPNRVTPGGSVVVTGTGFSPQVQVRLNGEAAKQLHIVDHSRLRFHAHRPTTTAPNSVGEVVKLELWLGGSKAHEADLVLDTFRILIFGDSIAWGQGLLEGQKFTALTARHLTEEVFRGKIGVYNSDRLAHSGAVIGPIPGEAAVVAGVPPVGEFPASAPSIIAQVAAWAAPAAMVEQGRQADLVLMDGGINDVNVRTILDPFGNDDALAAQTRTFCRGSMGLLINAAVAAFPNSRIIVTGYYQIVSEESDLNFLWVAIFAMGLLTPFQLLGIGPAGSFLLKEWLRNRLITRSEIFARVANTSLEFATFPRASLAIPSFGPRNAVFAPESFLFGVSVGPAGVSAEDPVAAARLAICAGAPACELASMGHPNERGAEAYFEAIKPLL